jgi:hypothetical protein
MERGVGSSFGATFVPLAVLKTWTGKLGESGIIDFSRKSSYDELYLLEERKFGGRSTSGIGSRVERDWELIRLSSASG